MKREKHRADRVKRTVISVLALVLCTATLFSVSRAWLQRQVTGGTAAGFTMQKDGKLMANQYHLETYYAAADGKWTLITQDFVRQMDKETDWTQVWDENSALFMPGQRTKFQTVVTSLVPETLSVSLWLQGVSVTEALKEKVKFVAYISSVPGSSVSYFCSDTEWFTLTGPESKRFYTAEQLPICDRVSLDGFGTLTVDWYVDADSTVALGSFPALVSSATEEPIMGTVDGVSCYYYVNLTDENGVPTEALPCDSTGYVLYSDEDHWYQGDYSATASSYIDFGDYKENVKISGLYVSIG